MTGGAGKYGRLFTEQDVLSIVDEVSMMGLLREGSIDVHDILALAIKRAEADKGPMRFPADEPLFVLRGQNTAALAGIRGYAGGLAESFLEVALRGDATALRDHINGVQDARERFEVWQAANPDRVKVPD